jgi:16S rRNA (uracil1498-N3)-methyltransferase
MRLIVATIVEGEQVITGDEHHYLARVRRAGAGDPIELVDGAGHRAYAEIVRITDSETVVRAGPIETVVERPPHVRVLVPLIKGDRMDTCLEKLVEVGADELVVWPARRSVVRLEPARRDTRLAQYASLAQAAARQCGRATTPSVTIVDSLAAALATLPRQLPGEPITAEHVRFVLDPNAERTTPPAHAGAITVASGPEGGLAPDELDALAAAGFLGLRLGPRVLRAETAPVIAVALIRAATAS